MVDKKKLSKRQLEIQLSKLKILEDPSLRLEQYPVSPEVASELLFMAGFEHNDLKGATIDLGTGTGRLAIGAVLIGANHVAGADIDPKALDIARDNARIARVDVEWIHSPVEKLEGSYDTVLMNPPYGTRTAHADLVFLDKAFQLAPIIYTIHKSATRRYLTNYMEKRGRKVDETRSMVLDLPNLFEFHRKKTKSVEVDLYRIV
ncbi:MAG TPA: METTL5 family protein [Candidatus Bathyarchaeia archaeon]|nr:METTL5 family protein [Candidatus Bathyarchaeia archaeon]